MTKVKENKIDERVARLEAQRPDRLVALSTAATRENKENPASSTDTTPKAKAPKLLPAAELESEKASTDRAVAHKSTGSADSPAAETRNDDDTARQEKTTTPQKAADQPQAPKLLGPSGRPNDPPVIIERNAVCSVERMIAEAEKRGPSINGMIDLMKTTDEYDYLDKI